MVRLRTAHIGVSNMGGNDLAVHIITMELVDVVAFGDVDSQCLGQPAKKLHPNGVVFKITE